MTDSRLFAGKEYLTALETHYPELIAGENVATVDDELKTGFIYHWLSRRGQLDAYPRSARFVPLANRPFFCAQHAWFSSRAEDLRWVAAAKTYKGLLNLKTPFDLVLYSNLIWELQPQTIFEFGALQGGSSLWFADQLEALVRGGAIHAFELLDKCIHPRARHPRLRFHHADLDDLDSLDPKLFADAPHPWLVIDDAHANIVELMRYVGSQMTKGDYYVMEDFLLAMDSRSEQIQRIVDITEELGWVVDAKYVDAFGTNVTSSANSWFVAT
jgi:cephalosporin hydroxylase